jgi:hypothetical protein
MDIALKHSQDDDPVLEAVCEKLAILVAGIRHAQTALGRETYTATEAKTPKGLAVQDERRQADLHAELVILRQLLALGRLATAERLNDVAWYGPVVQQVARVHELMRTTN